jgi:hypothetical protein
LQLQHLTPQFAQTGAPRPPLRRENALPSCAPDEAEVHDPFEGESLDSQGLPKPVVTEEEQVLLNGLERLRNEVTRPDTTEEEVPRPPPRKRRKRNTPLGPPGPEFDGREGDSREATTCC